jgi:hypothetical protein
VDALPEAHDHRHLHSVGGGMEGHHPPDTWLLPGRELRPKPPDAVAGPLGCPWHQLTR